MEKTPTLYNSWNECKKKIAFHKKPKNVHVWELWRFYNGMNIGSEVSKGGQFRRTCLVLKTNCWNGLVLIAPISTKFSKYNATHLISLKGYGREAYLILNQIQLVDRKRFVHIRNGRKRYNDSFVHKVLLDYVEFLTWDLP